MNCFFRMHYYRRVCFLKSQLQGELAIAFFLIKINHSIYIFSTILFYFKEIFSIHSVFHKICFIYDTYENIISDSYIKRDIKYMMCLKLYIFYL